MARLSFNVLELELWNPSERHMKKNTGGGERQTNRQTNMY